MARIFISHSSRDSEQAEALLSWLRERGWRALAILEHPDRVDKVSDGGKIRRARLRERLATLTASKPKMP